MILQKEQFDITGMTCSACSTRVEKSVAKLPGIKEVSVNLLKNSMVASYDESVLDTAGIVQAVEKAGYGAIPKASAQNKSRTTTPAAKPEVSTAQVEYKQMKQRLLLSALFTIPLFYISMGHMMGWPIPSSLLGMENAISFAFTQFLLLIPVVFITFKYYRMGFKTLFHGSPNMDSLIAIGSSAAIVYGIYAIYKIGIGFGHGDVNKEKQRELYTSPQVEIVRDIHKRLISNLQERPTIEELSKEYLINTATLKDTFKGVYGQPIGTYMKVYRMKQAAALLRQTQATIAEIASQVGYENQSKFATAFRDVMKIAPAEYRKQNSGD